MFAEARCYITAGKQRGVGISRPESNIRVKIYLTSSGKNRIGEVIDNVQKILLILTISGNLW
jgi:hypothetical protein